MTRTKTTEQKEKFQCLKCKENRVINSDSYYRGKNQLFDLDIIPVCKTCLKNYLNEAPNLLEERTQEILRLADRPFLYDLWMSSKKDWGEYYKQVAGLPQYRDLRYRDSNFNRPVVEDVETGVIESIQDKWGYGYTDEEYNAMERKFNMLKANYPEKTAMHTEALQTYVRYRVKEEISTAQGQIKDAKEWAGLASKAAQDAKINPSQLSKSDLTDGIDSFGELTRKVEQAFDVIEILPRFKERPDDSVDFTIWCYLNYVRDLQGLPLVKYADVYKFYDERKKEYEEELTEEYESIGEEL